MKKMQIMFFDNIAVPLHFKYDSQLGIVFYCPNCGKVSSYGDVCKECGKLLDRKNQIHEETIKIIW